MKKITITNGYTWYNKGDAGILLGTVNAVKEIFGEDIEINILSFTPNEDKIRYCKDVKIKNVFSNVLNPYPFKKTFLGKRVAIIKLVFKMLTHYLKFNFLGEKFINSQENIKILKDSDLIIVCGGGFLGGKKFNSFIHLYQIYINNRLNKPTILWGTSIEPFKNNIVKFFTEKQIKNLTHIFPREKITDKYLSTILASNQYTLIPDMAFMLENKDKEFEFVEKLRGTYNNIFGLTVRDWHFPNSLEPKLAKERYLNSIVNMIEYYAQNMNTVFVFVPQVIFEGDDDSKIAEEIRLRLKEQYKNNFIVDKTDWAPTEIKSLIGNFDLFIGTRMHSNIFSTSMAVPTVAIAYEKKTNGIMETVELEDYVIEIDTINERDLIEKIDKCYSNSLSIRDRLRCKILEIRKEIIQKSQFIKDL
ncbi:polysaccharide pyruvyl transferase family protein [Clostridium intestinale]|uniref:Polysaccharide pyruvyl transferase n=1 Tax=Clostridium intestinale URNW TaxID=1294142 RepID=U2NSJ8_9CLOT|nr:polysaccharide pyruvyl transferase family protein [Clostridium intestinale]ERK32148.1 polysaccharide pyruvyl transferase [Clostridium intestinale URNW]